MAGVLSTIREVFEQGLKTTKVAILGDLQSSQEETRTKENIRRARSQHDERWHQAELDVELERRIAELARRLQTSRTSVSTSHTNGAKTGAVNNGSTL